MLLGALVDLGVPLATLQEAVDAALPGTIRLDLTDVRRAGLRATHVEVTVEDDAGSRTWTDVRRLLEGAAVDDGVRGRALRTFERLAEAAGRGHGGRPGGGDLPAGGGPAARPGGVRA